ncbi:MAG: 50S ribosomal protein L5 [Candidatus Glassbacteria bacterium RIFCSPLOWO2_12_FULL_58_11]|uniref:Large ribosomal subunit protein uL5 n=2 Tax=Candidatus Glassiibacteriota TaxID=1817805 RepID=A0A1F5YPE5_9BACT|nr:ribosomal protein L5 [uncultured bacterium]OGF99739.1 MAG: 50S ribosomal protein L5 [Candidatus Glassbacteria bacterium GWA2_58_10]OGG01996.1 MAG: 50S ribosomal protein L5 [Candidatus Glassbacteria bacterium RIFCSPLOWO2_12_FULL_58_11]
MTRKKEQYEKVVSPKLKEEFGIKNSHDIPKLEKIVLNVGMGSASQNPKALETAQEELRQITGQHAVITRAKKSISNFKLREGMKIGCRVTLRRDKMWEFLDRLISVVIPRIRDFRGLQTKSFDGRGNYTLGVREQVIFPEIDYDKIEQIHGIDITFITTAKKDDQALALLQELGMPFRLTAAQTAGPAGKPDAGQS